MSLHTPAPPREAVVELWQFWSRSEKEVDTKKMSLALMSRKSDAGADEALAKCILRALPRCIGFHPLGRLLRELADMVTGIQSQLAATAPNDKDQGKILDRYYRDFARGILQEGVVQMLATGSPPDLLDKVIPRDRQKSDDALLEVAPEFIQVIEKDLGIAYKCE